MYGCVSNLVNFALWRVPVNPQCNDKLELIDTHTLGRLSVTSNLIFITVVVFPLLLPVVGVRNGSTLFKVIAKEVFVVRQVIRFLHFFALHTYISL